MPSKNCLVADVGGTHIRLGLCGDGDELIRCVEIYQCAEFEQVNDAIEDYLTKHFAHLGSLDGICLAVPGPTNQKVITLANNPWVINHARLVHQFNCPVSLINDFTAQAYCLSVLNESELVWLRNPEVCGLVNPYQQEDTSKNKISLPAALDYTKLVIGPGTGLGVAAMIPGGSVVESEGGHISFAPVNQLQFEILHYAENLFPRVSVERIVSGPGLALIYRALSAIQGKSDNELLSPRDITEKAKGGDLLCLQAVREFTSILGAVCGDLALAMGAMGGVYLSGGVLTKLDTLLEPDVFFASFQNKGRFNEYCAHIPVAKILADHPGLMGVANYAKTNFLL